MKLSHRQIQALIFIISQLFFLPFLGSTHLFDWDEINFAECAREMILTENYSSVMINFESFWEKPPLFFWLQVIAMKIFGINEFAARLPNALCGGITLVLLYSFGRRIFSRNMGLWWAAFYGASLLPHFYFRSGIIDPWFNLFIFLGVTYFCLYFFEAQKKPRRSHLVLGAIAIGLATLTKGPVAILIFGLLFIVFWISSRFRKLPLVDLMLLALITIVTSLSWFAFEFLRGNGEVISDFIQYQVRLLQTQDAGHGGPFYYHFVVLLFGCFPASIPALSGIVWKVPGSRLQSDYHRWMLLLLIIVLVLFSIVQTKIVHYSSLCYFPITFLAAYALTDGNARHWSKWNTAFLVGVGLILSLAFLLLPVAGMNSEWLSTRPWIGDQFAKEALKTIVPWAFHDFLPGLLLLGSVVFFTIKSGKNLQAAFRVLCWGSAISLFFAIAFFVPKIERFSQGPAIDFYKKVSQEENAIVHPIGFKSYAHLFYAKRQPPPSGVSYPADPVSEHVDRYVVYAISKIQEKENIEINYPQLEMIESKGGFVFWKKKQ